MEKTIKFINTNTREKNILLFEVSRFGDNYANEVNENERNKRIFLYVASLLFTFGFKKLLLSWIIMEI